MINALRLRASLLCVIVLIATPPRPALSGDTASTGVRQSFKFDPDERHILIPVHIGSKEYLFAVDTGATWTVFDSSLRSHLGEQVDRAVRAETGNAEFEAKSFRAPTDVKVGSLPFSDGDIVCENLALLREHTGSPIYGFLGMDFLNDWIVSIDFDEGQLDFVAPGVPLKTTWGDRVECAFRSAGIPWYPATLAKKPTPSFFLLDTGFPDTGALQETVFSELAKSGELRISGQRKVGGIIDEGVMPLGRISRLGFGTFEHKNLLLETCKNKNIIGLGYLRRFRVTIDFPREKLYLAKGKRFSEPDHGPMCGAYFLFKQDKIVVDYVDEKSPAHAAGVRAKDVLLQICGKQPAQLRPSAIRRLLSTEGKTITMTLRRANKDLEVKFTLKEYN